MFFLSLTSYFLYKSQEHSRAFSSLHSHDDSAGVIRMVSFGFRSLVMPVNTGIIMVENSSNKLLLKMIALFTIATKIWIRKKSSSGQCKLCWNWKLFLNDDWLPEVLVASLYKFSELRLLHRSAWLQPFLQYLSSFLVFDKHSQRCRKLWMKLFLGEKMVTSGYNKRSKWRKNTYWKLMSWNVQIFPIFVTI